MKYNFIETSDLYKSILELNHLVPEDLNKQYDFSINDEVFLNFKNKLLENKDKRFLIVGDYDSDGIGATTIIKRLFNFLNINSNHYIPSRLKEGYGLNELIVQKAIDNKFDCLILVDNGIVAYKELEKANDAGIKVFIIDHHEYEYLPEVEAIIHSNIVSDKFKDLSAGGLSFVLSRLFYEDDLSLVLGGLTTISDMMPVLNFNRYLINEMLNKINDIAEFVLLNDGKRIEYRDLSFNIIPKINAVSRMEPEGNPNYLVKYFNDFEFAKKFIQTINYLNDQRKNSTKYMSSLAYSLINEKDEIILITSSDFKEGLCGLIANRILHELNKPIIILAKNSIGEYKGSGRAPEGINLYELIKDFNSFKAFGGHEGAVGLTLLEEDLNSFKEYLKHIKIEDNSVKDVFKVNVDDLNFETIKLLDNLKPFGSGLKEPILAFDNLDYKKIIISNRFPKFLIRNDLSAISFNERYKDINPKTFIGSLSYDSYRKGALTFTIEEMLIKGL